ncbi:MAG: mechanosensitive ion channel [Cytophagaceae bacterium]|jgi:small conductance mechanosensitive channel|nr:mechanosensitive ion channel [Cytophagaceae bacterium]
MNEITAPTKEAVSFFQHWLDVLIGFAPTLAASLLVLVLGFWIARRVDKGLEKYFKRKQYDVSLEGFIRSLVSVGLKIVVVLTFAGMVGLPTTSLLAVFGAAGLAVGLALQGSLANFAGGVLILIFKPFKVGDVISSQGETGEVLEIQIFNTILLTADNKTVILANGAVSNGTIINVTRHGSLRVNLKVSIDFTEDYEKISKLIEDILLNDPDVLKTPAPTVSVQEFGESAVVLAIRPFAHPSKVPDVQNRVYEKIRKAFVDQKVKGPEIKRFVMD